MPRRALYPQRLARVTFPLNPVWVVQATAPFAADPWNGREVSTGLEFRASLELAQRSAEYDLEPHVLLPTEGAVPMWGRVEEAPDRAFADLADPHLDAVCALAVSDLGNVAQLWRFPRMVLLTPDRRVADAFQRALDARLGEGKLVAETPLVGMDGVARLRWLAEQLEDTLDGCPDELADQLTESTQ